jgi:phosphoglycerate kinase
MVSRTCRVLTPWQIGNSLYDEPGSQKVASLLEKAKANNVKVIFPVDYVTGDKFDKNAKVRLCAIDRMIMPDCGR